MQKFEALKKIDQWLEYMSINDIPIVKHLDPSYNSRISNFWWSKYYNWKYMPDSVKRNSGI